MPKKMCNYPGCNTIIPFTETYCTKHKILKKNKEKERYKIYNALYRDKKTTGFYHSKEWLRIRNYIINNYVLDLYAFYIQHRIVYANTVHHIVELKECWDKRLDINNLIPLHKSTHSKIHKLYEKNKDETQKLLYKLLDKYKKEYKG